MFAYQVNYANSLYVDSAQSLKVSITLVSELFYHLIGEHVVCSAYGIKLSNFFLFFFAPSQKTINSLRTGNGIGDAEHGFMSFL